MSQSPAENTPLDLDGSYAKGWDRLADLAASGHSFSGNERNCCFLNTAGGEKFADVSSITGLDFPDDGRGIGLVDWDHDGDLDLWIYNRTAPIIRLLRNDVPKSGQSIAFKLEGRQSNRDAIGARLTLEFVDAAGKPQKEIRTVRAGSGFLSQSSKWAHFGLGDNPTLERLTVNWPGGSPEVFSDLTLGSRYQVVQGSGKADALPNTPRKLALSHSLPNVEPLQVNGRGVISNRKPFPELVYKDFSGDVHEFLDLEGPVLVNLWASWCQPCLKELHDFSTHYEEIKAAGLSILALSTDGLGGPDAPGSQQAASKLVSRSQWPFASGLATNELMTQLTNWHNGAYSIRQNLPAPTSILIDREGRIAAIYKGPVSVEQLLKDVDLLDLDRDEMVAAALPFPGKFGVKIYSIGFLDYASASLQGGYLEHAKELVLEFLDTEKAFYEAAGNEGQKTLIKAYQLLAQTESSLGEVEASVKSWRQLVSIAPKSPQMQVGLAIALRAAGNVEESRAGFDRLSQQTSGSAATQRLIAITCLQIGDKPMAIKYFQRAIQLEPENTLFQIGLASVYLRDQQITEAINIYEALLNNEPKSPEAANNLAWLLSTSTDDSLRDGKRAVELAKFACEASQYKNPSQLGTLATAYAEAGDFSAAVETTQEAIRIFREHELSDQAETMQTRLKLYLNHQPFREGSSQ